MSFFLIKHKSGLFLKNEYVTASNRRSSVTLVDNEFPCFNSYDAAKDYINEGDELFYSYEEDYLKKEDLTIIQLNQTL
jgi:hypothetical protein